MRADRSVFKQSATAALSWLCAAAFWTVSASPLAAQDPAPELPDYLQDRGTGTPVSIFGTYVEKGQLIVYPFFEWELVRDEDYNPDDFGKAPDRDFTGDFQIFEELIFLGYGITEDLAFEVEAAMAQVRQDKDRRDPSNLPDTMRSSGFGDFQMELDWRFFRETETWPDLWSFVEVVVPHHEDDPLRGTEAWETKLGLGAIKGFEWGTVSLRQAVEHSQDETSWGEWAVEYLKRLSPTHRLYTGLEGQQSELTLILELQWRLGEGAVLKLNNAFGLTKESPELAPEVGVMFFF